MACATAQGPGPAVPASCDGLPTGSLGTLSSNFTLAAYTPDGSYLDSLVLAPSSLNVIDDVSQWVIAVRKECMLYS